MKEMMKVEMTQDQFKLLVYTIQERIKDLKARESVRREIEDQIVDLSNLLVTWMARGLV